MRPYRPSRRGLTYAAHAACMMEAGGNGGEVVMDAVTKTLQYWCHVENIDVRGKPSIDLLRQFVRVFRQHIAAIRADEDVTGRYDPQGANRAAKAAVTDLVARGVLHYLF